MEIEKLTIMEIEKLTIMETEKFKRGFSIYIISDRSSPSKKFMIDDNQDYNLGDISTIFENVLTKKRVLYPNMRLEFLIYTKYCEVIKKCILLKYEKKLILGWIFDIDLEEIIESIEHLFEFLDLELEV